MTTTSLLATVVPTPAGPLAVIITPEDGVVRAAGFEAVDQTAARLPAPLRARGVRELTAGEATEDSALGVVVGAVRRYAAGDGAALEPIPAEQPGGPFFQAAWAAMRAIPAGRTSTYAELAAAAGSPAAVRAAGSACARNLLAPFVPCHRVLRTGGDLGGYYYGLATKSALLALEGVPAAAAAPGARRGRAAELDLGLDDVGLHDRGLDDRGLDGRGLEGGGLEGPGPEPRSAPDAPAPGPVPIPAVSSGAR